MKFSHVKLYLLCIVVGGMTGLITVPFRYLLVKSSDLRDILFSSSYSWWFHPVIITIMWITGIALVMKLDKPFTFEGQTYTEVDLSGLEDTTAADLQAVGRFVTKKNPAANPATVEMTLEYAQFMAARVAHLPLEFFERLPAKEAIKLKGIVVGFLYGGAGDN